MAQAKKAQVKIKTTDRGGMARLVIGCVLTAVGLGWFFGLFMNTSSSWSTLRFFRDTANGLGGALCILLPFFALWGGGLLYASSRRRVSYRIYLCALGMYLCLLSILTLTTSVGNRTNSLMLYIGNSNKTSLGIVNNTSFTAYLRGAYNLRAFNGGQLAGGGLLGMLLLGTTQALFESLRFDSHMRYSFISMQQILFACMFAAALILYAARCGKKQVIIAIAVCALVAGGAVGLEFMIDRSSVSSLLLYAAYILLLALPAGLGLYYKKRSKTP